jgi:hypothetical protein
VGSLQQPFTVSQRAAAQVPAVKMQQVEGYIEEVTVEALRQRRLQVVKMGDAVTPERDHFPVEERRAGIELTEPGSQAGQALGPVVAAARDQAHAATVEPDEHAIAVQLELAEPEGTRRDGVGVGCELGVFGSQGVGL